MDQENTPRRLESVFSSKVKAGKRRTYFFDVRRTKGDDYYITLTESTKRYNDESYVRHKIFLYKEDFNRFLAALTEVVDHVKQDLMPNYDYDEFDRRQQEWERSRETGEADAPDSKDVGEDPHRNEDSHERRDQDDMSW